MAQGLVADRMKEKASRARDGRRGVGVSGWGSSGVCFFFFGGGTTPCGGIGKTGSLFFWTLNKMVGHYPKLRGHGPIFC